MEVFRISRSKYANALTASGSFGRWNLDRQYVIYTGSYRSLSTLELVVRRDSIIPDDEYKVMVISIADNDSLIKQVPTRDLPKDWKLSTAYPDLQAIGSDWYTNKESLILKVPSAIITQEFNYIINTLHPDFSNNVQLVRTENYFWDERLL